MDNLLKIENLNKKYDRFKLKDISFEVKPGKIVGFIGRNGAGKTTTIKSIMNLIHYDSGKIYAFDKDMIQFELENKQRIGFSLSELNYYPDKKVYQIVDVVKRFYKDFDMEQFNKLCNLFNIDKDKKLRQLSSGMKVKYSLALALSHKAELLILDEPTSGLDPVSRDEVLDIFRDIVKNKDKGILFSTHITSDLDKCADDISYIHNGEIIYYGSKQDFIKSYYYVKDESKNKTLLDKYISYKEFDNYYEGLISSEQGKVFKDNKIKIIEPDLDQIMIYLERREKHESIDL